MTHHHTTNGAYRFLDLHPAWTVTVENVGTVVASCEAEACELYEHYRKECIADIAAGHTGGTVTLRQGERLVMQF